MEIDLFSIKIIQILAVCLKTFLSSLNKIVCIVINRSVVTTALTVPFSLSLSPSVCHGDDDKHQIVSVCVCVHKEKDLDKHEHKEERRKKIGNRKV